MSLSQVGLVGAGGVSRSFLARAPALAARLGPVKAHSLSVAARLSNNLRAGRAATDYEPFDACGVVLIAVPESALAAAVAEIEASIRVDGKVILLCDSLHDSLWLEPLRALGAHAGSVNSVDGSDERRFVAEGDRQALREAERLFAHGGARLIEINRSAKPLYLSALAMATDLLLPLVSGAVESLRSAGLSRAQATPIVESLVLRSLRSYAKSGAKNWHKGRGAKRRDALEGQVDLLRLVDPRLAEFYVESAARAREFFTAPRREDSERRP